MHNADPNGRIQHDGDEARAPTERSPEGRYDPRVYLPLDGKDGTDGLSFSEIENVCRAIRLELLPPSVVAFMEAHRVDWGLFYDAVCTADDGFMRNPPHEILAEFEAKRRLPRWQYSERAHRIKDEARLRAFGKAMRGLPLGTQMLLKAIPREDFDAAIAAVGDVKALEGHLGPEGANSYFGSACGEEVNEAIRDVLHRFAERRDDLGRQARTAGKMLRRYIARNSKDHSAPEISKDVDSMEEAVIEVADDRGSRRTLRPALLKPPDIRGGDWEEEVDPEAPQFRRTVRSHPLSATNGHGTQLREADDAEIEGGFLDSVPQAVSAVEAARRGGDAIATVRVVRKAALAIARGAKPGSARRWAARRFVAYRYKGATLKDLAADGGFSPGTLGDEMKAVAKLLARDPAVRRLMA